MLLCRFRQIPTNNLVCDLYWLIWFYPMIFERCGSSADAELVRGSWSNQEPLSLSARLFFLFGGMVLLLSSLGPLFLFILAQGLFSALNFFHERNVNALRSYVRILSSARCKQNMQIIWNCREDYSQGTRSVTRLWHLPDLVDFIWKYVFLNNFADVR